MKTKNESIASTMAVSLEDLIFNNRNQSYGAYKLRKSYNKHLLIALIFTTFLLAGGIGVPFLSYMFFPANTVTELPTLIVPIAIIPEDKVVPPPPPPPKEPSNESLKQARNSLPIPVDTLEEDTLRTMPLPQEVISSGEKNDSSKIAYFEVAKPSNDIDEGLPYIAVQEPATFKGGDVNKFRDWVEQNINYPNDALSAEIQGKVYVTFVVNTKGEICNVNIIRGVHPSIDDETIKVLMNSPKWIPAKQDGKVVRQQFSIPIVYKIQ